jgi:hypothetical protein
MRERLGVESVDLSDLALGVLGPLAVAVFFGHPIYVLVEVVRQRQWLELFVFLRSVNCALYWRH